MTKPEVWDPVVCASGYWDKIGSGTWPWEVSRAHTQGCWSPGSRVCRQWPHCPSPLPLWSQLGGCGILGVGIWLAATQGNFATLSSSFPSLSAANLLIATGTLVMAIGFVGCIGAIKENRCLLLTVSAKRGQGVGPGAGSQGLPGHAGAVSVGWGPLLTGQGHPCACVCQAGPLQLVLGLSSQPIPPGPPSPASVPGLVTPAPPLLRSP